MADATSLANAAASEESIEPPALNASPPEKSFCEALKEAAEASEIPLPFFARLLWQESRFQSSEVSPAGAQGVAQFMPSTAAEVGLDDPFDPFKALPASARYLRQLHREFGNLGLAAAAYNAGSGRVQKWLSGRGKLPQETRIYVRRITGTSAENWVEEASTVSLRQELPDHAPCEGVGGLSRANELATVPVALTPSISEICRKAKAEAQRREAEIPWRSSGAGPSTHRRRTPPRLGIARGCASRCKEAGKGRRCGCWGSGDNKRLIRPARCYLHRMTDWVSWLVQLSRSGSRWGLHQVGRIS